VDVLLDAAPEADIVLLAHVGLEEATRMSALLDGSVLHRRLRVQLHRVPAESVPSDPLARRAWLHAQWLRMDAWVAAQLLKTRQTPP
jgi:hypothetical protein